MVSFKLVSVFLVVAVFAFVASAPNDANPKQADKVSEKDLDGAATSYYATLASSPVQVIHTGVNYRYAVPSILASGYYW